MFKEQKRLVKKYETKSVFSKYIEYVRSTHMTRFFHRVMELKLDAYIL